MSNNGPREWFDASTKTPPPGFDVWLYFGGPNAGRHVRLANFQSGTWRDAFADDVMLCLPLAWTVMEDPPAAPIQRWVGLD